MNKTIIININGMVFHIEEDAYEILKNYMTDVKRHFMNAADSLEITTDIENRVAEMFNELLASEHKQVIVEQDVRTVIGQMGTVEDFERSEQDTEGSFSPAAYPGSDGRRLFRDPDDHLLGGVCAGIASYFDIDVAWVRLAFALSFFMAGSGVLIYLILWMVIPKAATRADRMTMRGEKLNLQGFKRNFEEELGSVRNNLRNFGTEARPFAYKARDFAGDVLHHLGHFLEGLGRLLLKAAGLLIALICLGFVIFLLVALIALLSVGHFEPFHGLPYQALRHHHADYIIFSAFLVLCIPLLSIIVLVFKGIFHVGRLSHSAGSAALIIWLGAIGIFTFNIVGVAGEFKSSATVTETVPIKPSVTGTYYLKLNDLKYFTAADSERLQIKNLPANTTVTDDEDNDFDSFPYRNIHLSVQVADPGQQPVLVKSYRAHGPEDADAFSNARNIRYLVNQQDSVLLFGQRFYGKNEELWHNEEIDLTLKLPLNAKVIIDHNMERISNLGVYNCLEVNKKDYDKVSTATFRMTTNGLECKIDTLKADTAVKRSVRADSPALVK